MTNKKLTLLGIIAAVMIVLVLTQSGTKDTKSVANDAIKYLIQGLDTSNLTAIEVTGSGDDNATLVKGDDGFIVKELSGYPAKVSEINNLITKCLDIKVGKVYTSEPSNFEDLGVSEDNAKAIVKFKGADDKLVTGVVVSEYKDGKTYVRRIDSDDVYLAQESLWLTTSPQSFVDKQLTKVEKSNITEVNVQAGVDQYAITSDSGKAQLQNIPEGKNAKQAEVDKVFGAITSLRFDEVKKSGELNGLNFNNIYTCKLSDSTVYTVKLAKKDDKTYASLTAEFTDTTPVTKDKGVESEEQLKKKEAKLIAHEAANNFSKAHKGWIYTIPSYQADNLTMALDSLLEDAPKPEPAPQPAEAVAPAPAKEQTEAPKAEVPKIEEKQPEPTAEAEAQPQPAPAEEKATE
ncbi:MAG: DUF4340 domain-containing protein [Sedimentisphaeraceae bacterium JB056]